MFKKVALLAFFATALSGCYTLHQEHQAHVLSYKEYVTARVDMIQLAPEVCTEKFALTEDGSIAVGLLAGGLIGSVGFLYRLILTKSR